MDDERICPNCSAVIDNDDIDPDERLCPECGAELPDEDEALTDKSSADSFPASDPPSY